MSGNRTKRRAGMIQKICPSCEKNPLKKDSSDKAICGVCRRAKA